MKQPSNPQALWPAILAMILLVVIWTANLLLSRYSVLEGLSSYDLTALRYSVAGLILLPNFFRIGGLQDLGGLGWKKGLILSFLAGPPYMMAFYYGFKLAPVSHAAVLALGIVPTVVFLGLVLTGRTSFSLAALCSLILIIVGLIFVTASSFSIHRDVLMGDACFIVGGTFWGLFTFLSRIWKVSPMPSVTVICRFVPDIHTVLFCLFLRWHRRKHLYYSCYSPRDLPRRFQLDDVRCSFTLCSSKAWCPKYGPFQSNRSPDGLLGGHSLPWRNTNGHAMDGNYHGFSGYFGNITADIIDPLKKQLKGT